MNDLEEVLVEVHRLQMLAFIGRYRRGAPCVSTWDVAQWLRLPMAESSLLVAELTEEGFVAGVDPLAEPFQAPLQLTPLGLGVLEWNRERTVRLATAEEPPPRPPAGG
jgi:hypothetical protein